MPYLITNEFVRKEIDKNQVVFNSFILKAFSTAQNE